MSIQEERDRLLQKEWREKVIPKLGSKPWIRIYQSPFEHAERQACLFCALVPNRNVEKVLQTYNWDVRIGDSAPSFLQVLDTEDDKESRIYDRYGHRKYGIEPLVIVRQFLGLRPETIEISEEFRLYHNLYYEQSNSTYVKFDDIGDPIPVVRMSERVVDINRKHIRQFLAAKGMSLVLYFERMCFSPTTLEQLSILEADRDFVSNKCVYRLSLINRDWWVHREEQSQSWILGKRIIKGLPLEKCGLWPFGNEVEREYANFIIDVDSDGEPISFTSDPDKLANYFGKNPDAPQYVTPVYFQRKVLQKYYNEPSKYSIEDGHLRCDGLWGIRLDTSQPDYVIALLGDLGRDLPAKEHAQWKHYNVVPDGPISDTAFRRWFLGEFAEPEDRSIRFKDAYERLSFSWQRCHSWRIFMELMPNDSHHFATVRRPTTRELAELDEIVLSLSKLLVDSININDIRCNIPNFDSMDSNGKQKRGISILAEYLSVCAYDDSADHIGYLRKVQALRSSSAAHRKGKNFEKAAKFFELDKKSTIQVADDIFTTLTDFLDSLREHFCPDESG